MKDESLTIYAFVSLLLANVILPIMIPNVQWGLVFSLLIVASLLAFEHVEKRRERTFERTRIDSKQLELINERFTLLDERVSREVAGVFVKQAEIEKLVEDARKMLSTTSVATGFRAPIRTKPNGA